MSHPAPFIIRPAAFADARGIFARIKEHPNELVPRALSNIIFNIDRFLVAEADGEIIGSVSWEILPELEHEKNPSVEIQSLCVRGDWQQKGLGRALVAAALDRVRGLHPSQVIVLTFTPDFFAKLGFHTVDKRTLIYKLYKGCLHCAKYDSPFTCPEVAMAMDLSD